ncbi:MULTISPECIES: UDP-glucose 4-epimerase GalE [Asaia]|uniref:UDP-glucose 4-epimerase GalE n=1 Tax=Asaia TaxID=91914 RepID=UPI0025565A82|nr:UDP-glucose 4-epimerase GalE [Asaia sp. HumB]MDL2171157.1 UDP-glucose 4-epimerase GalE [Asaia sp. HumB]
MRFLITGGAGFVGSHVAISLLDAGHEVVILDNLSTGHRKAIPTGARFEIIDLANAEDTNSLVSEGRWDAVLHFAALSLVGASMAEPYTYLRQNTITSLNLIEACTRNGIEKFIFSSTAALFGGSERTIPISDSALIDPGSPYGESKFIIERALRWADRIHGMRYACLRYFNAAGADRMGRLGEDHHPETHLIPLTIDAMLGRRPALRLFGQNYPTPDGTCIRDYVHVADLADAHIRAISRLDSGSVSYNLGNGSGFSNLEVIRSVERVSGKSVPWQWDDRREGDPAILIADSTRIREETGWNPEFSDIDSIVATALAWRVRHPNGYASD